MNLSASILIDGVSYAMVLFMISVGLSMTMGLMRVVNLAHGGFAMAGGFLAATLPALLNLPFEIGVVLAVAGVGLLSLPIEALLIRRFYRRSTLDQMLLTIGLMFIFMASANLLFGSSITTIRLPAHLSGTVDLGFRTMATSRLAVIGLGAVVAAALWFTVERSTFGIRVRAAVDNPSIAQAVGIDTRQVYAAAFAIGAMLAALGGIAGAELLPMEPSYAAKHLVLVLAVVAVGGHGTLLGSFLAAILLGLMDTMTKYLVPELSSIVFFLTMFVVLIVRPHGLLGKG